MLFYREVWDSYNSEEFQSKLTKRWEEALEEDSGFEIRKWTPTMQRTL